MAASAMVPSQTVCNGNASFWLFATVGDVVRKRKTRFNFYDVCDESAMDPATEPVCDGAIADT